MHPSYYYKVSTLVLLLLLRVLVRQSGSQPVCLSVTLHGHSINIIRPPVCLSGVYLSIFCCCCCCCCCPFTCPCAGPLLHPGVRRDAQDDLPAPHGLVHGVPRVLPHHALRARGQQDRCRLQRYQKGSAANTLQHMAANVNIWVLVCYVCDRTSLGF